MKFLIATYLVSFLLMLLFGNIKINGYTVNDIMRRVIPSMVFAFIVTLFIGLPILGLISLF